MSQLAQFREEIVKNNSINPELYHKFDVKRGLRNADGTGVLAGLTRISSVQGYTQVERELMPMEGVLKYRGIEIEKIVADFNKRGRLGFEATCFLLLIGRNPNEKELNLISKQMQKQRVLPKEIIENCIQGLPSKDIMNKLQTCISGLYGFDQNPDTIDPFENFLKSVDLFAKLPLILAYSYLAAYVEKPTFVAPLPTMSTAEAFLYCLNQGKMPSTLEAQILDLCLILHAEHGGGNNSTFTTYVVTSSNTDIYSTIAAAISSLKGPLHGAANSKVMQMMETVKAHVKNWSNKKEVCDFLAQLVRGEAGDKSGKIYGLGHAVYTLSDPRATQIKSFADKLAAEKKRTKEMKLYHLIAQEGPKVFAQVKGSTKVIAPNVDFFSGFVYDCLGIPEKLYTPLFAMARTAGWCAHRIEETISGKRIIRPGYKYIAG